MKTRILLMLMSGLLAGFVRAHADALEVGDAIPELTAEDQHGRPYTFTNGTAYVLIALDMSSAKAANQALAKQGAGFLEKHRAAYWMDIHTMPGVGRFFALRKMREYRQRIVLVKTDGTLNWAPHKSDHITVLKLTPDGHVEHIDYWQPAEEPATDVFQPD